MKHSSILLVLPIACLMACSSNDDIDEPTGKEVPILIEVSETPLTDPEAGSSSKTSATRAPISTKETLSEFYMNGYWSSGKLQPSYVTRTDNNSKWETTGSWPSGISDDTDVHFYAFANVDNYPSPFNYGGNSSSDYNPFLYFMVDENAEEQKDLLVATQTSKKKDGTVFFHFTHPCAALQFAICKTQALTNFDIEVEKIVLHNIYSCGSYYFNSGNWVVDTDELPSDFSLFAYNHNSISVQTEVSSTDRTKSTILGKDDSDYLFFIPQTIQAWQNETETIEETENAYIEIVCSIQKNSIEFSDNGSVYLPFAATLEKGYIHRFNIRMGTSLKDSQGHVIDFRKQ